MSEHKRISESHGKESGSQTADGTKTSGQEKLRSSEQSSSQIGVERTPMRVALVHDWLNGMRGGEIVFEALLDLYPHAEVFTLIYEPQKLSPALREKLSRTRVHTSFLNLFRFSRKNYRQLLPLLPFAIRTLNVYPFDLVISSSHCVAKGVKKRPGAFHLSYIHAPMRYMWDRFDDYFGPGRMNFIFRMIALVLRPLFQAWDRATAQERCIDQLIGNSRFIAEQIKRCYGRDAGVVYPFAKLERFVHSVRKPGNFYLMVTAFAPYKRTDLAIAAFARLGLPLKIVGHGQDEAKLHALKFNLNAQNIEFLEDPTNQTIEALYAECKALIFPGKEDFGITPLEAMASGAPVIAFGEGGACETVTAESGILFTPQTIEALSEAIMDIESGRKFFDVKTVKNRASFFTEARFKNEIQNILPERFR